MVRARIGRGKGGGGRDITYYLPRPSLFPIHALTCAPPAPPPIPLAPSPGAPGCAAYGA